MHFTTDRSSDNSPIHQQTDISTEQEESPSSSYLDKLPGDIIGEIFNLAAEKPKSPKILATIARTCTRGKKAADAAKQYFPITHSLNTFADFINFHTHDLPYGLHNITIKVGRNLEGCINEEIISEPAIKSIYWENERIAIETLKNLNNPNLAIKILIQHPSLIKYANIHLQNNRDFLINLILNNAAVLQHLEPQWQTDRQIVLKALRSPNIGFSDARKAIKLFPNDYAIIFEAVGIDSFLIGKIDDRFQTDPRIALKAMQQNGMLFYVHESLRDDFDIVLAAVRNNPNALKFASARLRADPTIVAEAVSNHGGEQIEFALGDARYNDTVLKAEEAQFSDESDDELDWYWGR